MRGSQALRAPEAWFPAAGSNLLTGFKQGSPMESRLEQPPLRLSLPCQKMEPWNSSCSKKLCLRVPVMHRREGLGNGQGSHASKAFPLTSCRFGWHLFLVFCVSFLAFSLSVFFLLLLCCFFLSVGLCVFLCAFFGVGVPALYVRPKWKNVQSL